MCVCVWGGGGGGLHSVAQVEMACFIHIQIKIGINFLGSFNIIIRALVKHQVLTIIDV